MKPTFTEKQIHHKGQDCRKCQTAKRWYCKISLTFRPSWLRFNLDYFDCSWLQDESHWNCIKVHISSVFQNAEYLISRSGLCGGRNVRIGCLIFTIITLVWDFSSVYLTKSISSQTPLQKDSRERELLTLRLTWYNFRITSRRNILFDTCKPTKHDPLKSSVTFMQVNVWFVV